MSNGQSDVERGELKGQHIEHEDQLRNVLTNTMSISPELFERLYLGPQNKVSGDLRRTFANPVSTIGTGCLLIVRTLTSFLTISDSNGGHGIQCGCASAVYRTEYVARPSNLEGDRSNLGRSGLAWLRWFRSRNHIL